MIKKASALPPIERIDTHPDKGLTAGQAEERAAKGYLNKTTNPNEKTTAGIIAHNLFTFFNIVLFTIAAIFFAFILYLQSIGRSDIVNTHFGFSKFFFLVPALMNVSIGTFQEVQSLKVIKKLRIVTSTKSKVVRDGEVQTIEASQIVPDDIVAVAAGDQATADLLVLTGEVEVDESMLTGESDHVKKLPGDTILSGSAVMVGAARCRAEKIGADTYISELTRKVKSTEGHKSELMTSIMKIIKVLTVCLCVAIAAITATLVIKISANGGDPAVWGRQMSLDDPVTWSLLVLTDGMFGIGMIPSGLVLTTSVALMVSIAGLTKKQTLVQELYSLENLSRVDTICLDKTGTLTDGTMSVSEVKAFAPDEEIKRHMRLLMGASDDKNATSEAILAFFGAGEAPQFSELIPFSSANKYAGVVRTDGKKLLMGAPEYLLPEGDERLAYVTEQAMRGNRVIAVTLDGELEAFIAIEDHIRDTAADTLRFFRENGVTVKVISGDNPLTVSKIAEKCGIVNADKYISLADVSLEEIPQIAEEYTVFARVSPEQKEALVAALQAKKHKVAMTGDGVNDILALRRSDSSITFAKATEAAKSCADVILLDNDFSHLREVVGEGRRVIGNIQKTTVLYLMKSIAVFLLAFALIPFAKAQMWYAIENMYMLEAAVIGTGGFLISLEPQRIPIKGSFLKKILSQAPCAGALAACAVMLPILLYTVPVSFGYPPIIAGENVRAMITVMVTTAGIIVVFSMCLPFNRYRALALAAVTSVTTILGLLLPSSYVGGQPITAPMLAFDASAGETVFDCQLMREMFRPLNSPTIQALFSDINNYFVMRLFLYLAIPMFLLVRIAVENHSNRAEIRKKGEPRSIRIGRDLMFVSGIVLILRSVLMTIEVFTIGSPHGLYSDYSSGDFIAVSVLFSVFYLTAGIIGYLTWSRPGELMMKIAFFAGIALMIISISPLAAASNLDESAGMLLRLDCSAVLIMAVIFVIGAWGVGRHNIFSMRDQRKNECREQPLFGYKNFPRRQCVDKRTVIYYQDELNDEFSTAVIKPRRIDESYVYDRSGPFRTFTRFFWYRIVATPPAFLYVKLSLHQRTVGREKLKPFCKTGFFIYGNHTQSIGDPLTPNVFCFPQRVSFIVHANNVSMPVLGRINPSLGAIPLPDTREAHRNFENCVNSRIEKGSAVVIYPEAHIWPYYTKIRPFSDASFGYPAKSGTPVFCFVNTYQKRRGRKKPRTVTYIDGPFYPDMTLPVKQRRKALRDAVYAQMCERAKLSDTEVIKYIKRVGSAEST